MSFYVNYDAEAAKETYRKVKLLLENGADKALRMTKMKQPL